MGLPALAMGHYPFQMLAMDLNLNSVQVPTPEVGLVALPCCTQGSFLCSDGPLLQKPSLQAHLQNLLGSQCCLVMYLDSLAQVQTSSQVQIS